MTLGRGSVLVICISRRMLPLAHVLSTGRWHVPIREPGLLLLTLWRRSSVAISRAAIAITAGRVPGRASDFSEPFDESHTRPWTARGPVDPLLTFSVRNGAGRQNSEASWRSSWQNC